LGRRATVAKNNVSVKGKMKTGAFGQNPLKKIYSVELPQRTDETKQRRVRVIILK
jgi:hypothetical protein